MELNEYETKLLTDLAENCVWQESQPAYRAQAGYRMREIAEKYPDFKVFVFKAREKLNERPK